MPMSRIAAPKTVLTPGMETGTKKTMVRNAVRIKRPSWPTRSRISAKVTPPGGRLSVIVLIFSPSDSVLSKSPGTCKWDSGWPGEWEVSFIRKFFSL